MRILVGLFLIAALLAGCDFLGSNSPDYAAIRQQQRQELVARFQEVYPDTWKEELLKYDIAINQRRASQPIILPPTNNIQPFPMRQRKTQEDYNREAMQLNRDNDLRQINENLRGIRYGN